ncbi:MAG TPA: SagB/ThcOx family dehydrogenase [Anaerolineaceae bacterium]|jgi:SagB-type dehydrogenase family enzyme|nr:SagB/ThcOx family dehydrogenase [Anaerolineaceae bacterium]
MTKNSGYKFMLATRYSEMGPSAQNQGVPQPALETDYPLQARLIPLPDQAGLTMPGIDLRRAIEERVSIRQYAPEPLTLEELTYLLWTTQGVKAVTPRPVTLRTVPSAGARHAFETFLLINRVEGIEPGLYRYLAIEHALLPITTADGIAAQLTEACLKQPMINTSAVTFFWVAAVERMFWRYSERGYRYLHLDAGHICQNLYLAAWEINCGTCAIAAFDDDLLNTALGVDGETMLTVYLATVGRKGKC